MSFSVGVMLLASMANAPDIHRTSMDTTHPTRPALVEGRKGPRGLTLYNAKGDIVARCGRKNQPARRLQDGTRSDVG